MSLRRRILRTYERISNFLSSPAQKPIEFVSNIFVNRYQPDRVLSMGPDIACLEWLMNCGSTSVIMSNGLKIASQREMRDFIRDQGIDIKDIKKTPLPPDVSVVDSFNSAKDLERSIEDDKIYLRRWPHISPIHIKEVDATDAVLTDRGFTYFVECRRIERLKMNHCLFISSVALRELSRGRPARTLLDLEIVFNNRISEDFVSAIARFKSLRRLHLYFLPNVKRRDAILRHLRLSLPKCKVTFPETLYIGYGYEAEGNTLMQQPNHGQNLADQRHRRI